MSRAKMIMIALDQLLNTLLGGWCDETLSSRSYRWDISGARHWPRRWIDGIAARLGDVDHCRASYESERLGRQLPPELRGQSGQGGAS